MYLFIINRFSGNGRGQRAWRIIESELQNGHIPHQSVMLDSDKAMEKISTSLHNEQFDWKAVIIVGGDGTIHSLLPLLLRSSTPISIIPAGSGNDTARALGIPLKPVSALKHALNGKPIMIDLIKTTLDNKSEYTLTAVATGFDGMIARKVDASFYKRWCNRLGLGPFAYIIALLQTLATFRPFQLSVTIDGAEHTFNKGWLVAIANTSSYGGGLAICPSARYDDKLLDVCIVHSCTPLQLLSLFPTILFGKHTKLSFVTILSGCSIVITADKSIGIPSMGDGELLGTPPLHAEILPLALKVIK